MTEKTSSTNDDYLSAREELHRTRHPVKLHNLVQNRFYVPLQAQAPMGLLANIRSAPTPLNFVFACSRPVGCRSAALDPFMPKPGQLGLPAILWPGA